MHSRILSCALGAITCALLNADLAAHGGQYRGPGDIVPPGGGGRGGQTGRPRGSSGPTTGRPGSPTAPAPSGPATTQLHGQSDKAWSWGRFQERRRWY